jgi:hypothetical protein
VAKVNGGHKLGPDLRADQSLTPGDNPRIGPTRFEDWLALSTSMAGLLVKPSIEKIVSRARNKSEFKR